MDRVAVYMGTRNVYRQMAAACKSLLYHTRVDRVWFLIEDDALKSNQTQEYQALQHLN